MANPIKSLVYRFRTSVAYAKFADRVFGLFAGSQRLSNLWYLLRRNTHRLEKGLIMRPRRSVFARDYILETVTLYASLTQHEYRKSNRDLLQWTHDVLDEYFACVGPDPVVDRAQQIFANANAERALDTEDKRPYCRDLDSPLGISIEQLQRLAERRRSCRWFEQKPVPRSVIDAAIKVAAYSPSACNRQPFQFRIFDDPPSAQTVGRVPYSQKKPLDEIRIYDKPC